MIGLVATAMRYGRKDSRVVRSISYSTVPFVRLNVVSRIGTAPPLVSLVYTLCALP